MAAMDDPYIANRAALADAARLIERYGDEAEVEAASRAHASRDAGNVSRFCHWRQIERMIVSLTSGDRLGSLH